MGRPGRKRWTPSSEEQRVAVDAVYAAATVSKAAGAELDKADAVLFEAVATAAALKVPVAHLAAASGKGRDTIYRHLPDLQEEQS